MKIDVDTRLYVVTDPGPHSTLPDICFRTTLDGLRLQFAGGLSMDQNPVLFSKRRDAHEEAKSRLLAWKIARRIRSERGLPLDEVVRIALHDEAGKVVWSGDVR